MSDKFINNNAKVDKCKFKTISEVAVELSVNTHVIRFWEKKISQISPLKRGGGRRYYREEDIEILRCVRDLIYKDGLTIKGVGNLFNNNNVKNSILSTIKRNLSCSKNLESINKDLDNFVQPVQMDIFASVNNNQKLEMSEEQKNLLELLIAELDSIKNILNNKNE